MSTLTVRKNNMFDTLFNDVFDDFFADGARVRPIATRQAQNARVYDNDENWQIVFPVPGVKKDQVIIKVDDHVLTVSYEKKKEEPKFNFVSSFSRSWNIERDVDVEKIAANHEDGILTITIPKPDTKKRVVRPIQVN